MMPVPACVCLKQRWNAHETSSEEYEAEGGSKSRHFSENAVCGRPAPNDHAVFLRAGQMHLWNPDEPTTPRGSLIPLTSCVEERLREACGELLISWDGCAGHAELLALCEHLGLEVREKTSGDPLFQGSFSNL